MVEDEYKKVGDLITKTMDGFSCPFSEENLPKSDDNCALCVRRLCTPECRLIALAVAESARGGSPRSHAGGDGAEERGRHNKNEGG